MPIYEYECPACGGRFEEMRKFSDPDLTECRMCKRSPVRKVLSPTAFVLKGSGWYATDYASGDRKKGMESDKPKEAAPAKTGCPGGGCAGGTCPSKG